MKNEELAYKSGFRITPYGYVYKRGRKKVTVSYKKNSNRPSFHFKCNLQNRSITVYVHRFLAYCHKPDQFKSFHFIGLKDGDFNNICIENLDFGRGSELITSWHNGLKSEQIAVSFGYHVDNTGVLYYLNQIVKPIKLPSGYYSFSINVANKKPVIVFTHRLQAYQKYGLELYNEGMLVRHLNDVKTDNRFENIQIGTHTDNFNDMSTASWNLKYEKAKNTRSRYSLEDRVELRKLFDQGWTYNRLMKKFGYSKSTVYKINVLERNYG